MRENQRDVHRKLGRSGGKKVGGVKAGAGELRAIIYPYYYGVLSHATTYFTFFYYPLAIAFF